MAIILAQPDFIPQPWAQKGNSALIPNTKQEFGRASWAQGFPTETTVALNAGGIAPNYLDFQGIFKKLSQFAYFAQSGGKFAWSSTLDYLTGCTVLGSDGKTYTAKQASGPNTDAGAQNPVSDTKKTYWNRGAATTGGGGGGGGIVGEIIAFSGSFGGENNRFPIPRTPEGEDEEEPSEDFCLCDGITTNGLTVPDLRGRMILGANDTYSAGTTGGNARHTHSFSGSIDKATLSVAQLAAHVHNFKWNAGKSAYEWTPSVKWTDYQWSSGAIASTGKNAAHTHGLSNVSSTPASTLPPYYALAYIMRIA